MTKINNHYIDGLVKDLINYYKDKGLVIIGLNDSQGVNVNTTFFKKGMLEYLSYLLKSEELEPNVINAFSLLFNKTEHIDYFLKNNLSIEQIKHSQVYSSVEALKKVMVDFHSPEFIGNVAYISKLIHTIKQNDNNVFVTTTLKEANEPTVIYSSGVNNLMREIGNNPSRIVKDYKNRNVTPHYNYSVEQAKKTETLATVINGIERNFENILAINENTDIYALGAYTPNSLKRRDIDSVFSDLIKQYNLNLRRLCQKYNIRYINTESILSLYNKSELNFHITSEGHNALAHHIIEVMHHRKIVNSITSRGIVNKDFQITNEGINGMVNDIHNDCDRCYKKELLLDIDQYEYERAYQISSEREREEYVFQKIYRNESRKKQR